jgi:hypothetical protein
LACIPEFTKPAIRGAITRRLSTQNRVEENTAPTPKLMQFPQNNQPSNSRCSHHVVQHPTWGVEEKGGVSQQNHHAPEQKANPSICGALTLRLSTHRGVEKKEASASKLLLSVIKTTSPAIRGALTTRFTTQLGVKEQRNRRKNESVPVQINNRAIRGALALRVSTAPSVELKKRRRQPLNYCCRGALTLRFSTKRGVEEKEASTSELLLLLIETTSPAIRSARTIRFRTEPGVAERKRYPLRPLILWDQPAVRDFPRDQRPMQYRMRIASFSYFAVGGTRHARGVTLGCGNT